MADLSVGERNGESLKKKNSTLPFFRFSKWFLINNAVGRDKENFSKYIWYNGYIDSATDYRH